MFSSRPGSVETSTGAKTAQRLNDVLNQHLRRRGTGSDADRTRVAHPIGVKFAAIGDQIARNARLGADLAQPIGVRAILGAHDQNHIDDPAKLPHRGLPILRGIADVSDVRTHDDP